MLADGSVDAVISRAPEAEQRHACPARGLVISKNRALVVRGGGTTHGSRAGARSGRCQRGVSTHRRLSQTFVSRGDESGTHERERSLWKAAGRQPEHPQLIVSGAGMAQALRHADAARAYVLTDVPTFRQLADGLDLQILFETDARLFNSYAVISGKAESANALASWLTGADGRAAIASFTIAGRAAFEPWPAGCAGTRRGSITPCLARTR